MLIGIVNHIPRFKETEDPDKKPRYFAFVRAEGKSYFFHVSQYKGDWHEFVKIVEAANKQEGVKVSFEINENKDGKLQAKNVSLL